MHYPVVSPLLLVGEGHICIDRNVFPLGGGGVRSILGDCWRLKVAHLHHATGDGGGANLTFTATSLQYREKKVRHVSLYSPEHC